MKRIILLIMFISINSYAYTLSDILYQLKQSNKAKYISDKTESQIAQNELISSYEAPELGITLSQVDSAEDGTEYSVGLSQNLAHPFSTSTKQSAVDYLTKSLKQGAMHEMHLLNIELALRYHNTCVSKEMKAKANLLYKEQSIRVNQLQRAYDLGEISRKNLLFNKLDLIKLNQKVSLYKRAYLVDFAHLQEGIDNMTLDKLSCSDLFEIKRTIKLKNISEHSELKKVQYEERSSKAFYNTYDSFIQSLSYGVLFEQELDTKRYTVGISIPLSPLTSSKEKERTQYLYMNSAYNEKLSSMNKSIKHKSESSVLKLGALYDEYILLKDEILPLNIELMNLSKSAYSEGEASIMEYIDATRSNSENVLEMLEVKKNYYQSLFELYKIADIDLGENND